LFYEVPSVVVLALVHLGCFMFHNLGSYLGCLRLPLWLPLVDVTIIPQLAQDATPLRC
jgi:hypothetical protein